MDRSTLVAAFAAVVVGIASYNVLSIDAKWDAKAVSAAEAAAGPKQVVDTDELMKILMDPTFEDLKSAIETMPEKRRAWRTLSIAASNLAEINNLLYFRTDEDYMKTPEWTAAVAKSQSLNIDLAAYIKDKTNAEYGVMKEKFMLVMQSCNDCHTNLAPDAELDDIEAPEAWLTQ